MSIITPELSKQVGWKYRPVTWPTLQDVTEAGDYQLLMWYRFLPSPGNATQIKIINAITARVRGGNQ